VKLVPTTQLQAYDLLRHEHLMLSKQAAEKLSSALGANKAAGTAVQIEPAAARPEAREAAAAPAPRAAKAAKRAKKPVARAKTKPARKPKGKKD
jgi:hypothetical protein